MSIEIIVNLCLRDAIHLRREQTAPTQDAEGQFIKTWTANARGALPADNRTCWAQELSPEAMVTLGVTAPVRMWKLFFSFDPFLDNRDHVFFTEESGAAVEAEIRIASRDVAGMGGFYVAIAQYYTPGH